MKFLHDFFESQKPNFQEGGKLEKFYYLFEATETFMFTPPTVSGKKGVHIHDAIDLKRMMITVVIAMLPCLVFGMWNVGYQHFLATGQDTSDTLGAFLIGAQLVLPIVLVSYTAGGLCEVVFGIIRKHPINEGFLVTGMLIPLIIPATIPLWQVALASIFGVVLAKEVFGGTGMNILNVALTVRAFLYFAYPQQISGEIWTYLGDEAVVDGYSMATPLAVAASTSGQSVVQAFEQASPLFGASNLFLGVIPGSIGETSVVMRS